MNLDKIMEKQLYRSRIAESEGFGGIGKGVFNSRFTTLCKKRGAFENVVMDIVGIKATDPQIDLRAIVSICLLLDTTPNYLLGFDGDDKCS